MNQLLGQCIISISQFCDLEHGYVSLIIYETSDGLWASTINRDSMLYGQSLARLTVSEAVRMTFDMIEVKPHVHLYRIPRPVVTRPVDLITMDYSPTSIEFVGVPHVEVASPTVVPTCRKRVRDTESTQTAKRQNIECSI